MWDWLMGLAHPVALMAIMLLISHVDCQAVLQARSVIRQPHAQTKLNDNTWTSRSDIEKPSVLERMTRRMSASIDGLAERCEAHGIL